MRAILLVFFLAVTTLPAQITYNRLLHAKEEPQNWLTYWGDYSAIRHRTLDQINTKNVKDLRLAWMYQTGRAGVNETVPLVIDGIMYATVGDGIAVAIDARSGRPLWSYHHNFPPGHATSGVNRGFGVLGERLFMVTPDSNLVALDIRTGRLIWQAEMAPYKAGTHYATLAPLVIKDKVLVGISGGEQAVRGFIDAYDAATGKRAWRFWTIPSPDEPGGDTWLADSWQRGGGPAWLTGTYDPQLNTTYWGIGNPGPDLYGGDRKGDNLYSCSLVALDPDTGKLKWHFQFTPHDLHDWDATETPMLLDLNWKGRVRKVVVQANRNAFFYVLDRETGEYLLGKPYARQDWAKELDSKGRPILMSTYEPTQDGTHTCPGLAGGNNWMATTYNPLTKLFYVSVQEACNIYYSAPPVYQEGKPYWGSVFRGPNNEETWGALKAIDPTTGETKWEFRYHQPSWAGNLSTSGGLIFSGDEDGYLMAFDAAGGKNLWKINTGVRLVTAPITFMVNGKQYITMPSGAAILTFTLPDELTAAKPAASK
jgi:alcohol dehydrogenase (cytochrome c)